MLLEKQNTELGIEDSKQTFKFGLRRANCSPDSPQVQVDFSPTDSNTSSTAPQIITEGSRTFPVINSDRCFYTPCFIIEADKIKYVENADTYLMLHERKKLEMTEEKLQLFVPKPSKGNSYCCVCKNPFDDYLTHVNIPRHQELMRSSKCCNLITELCGQFSQAPAQHAEMCQKTRQKKVRKTKKCKKAPKKGSCYLSSTSIQEYQTLDSKLRIE